MPTRSLRSALAITLLGSFFVGSFLLAGPASPVSARCIVPKGSGPGYNASIGDKDNGVSVCITVKEKLLVSLSAPTPAGPDWEKLRLSSAAVLTTVPLLFRAAPGTTATVLQGKHAGTIHLTSFRPVCPSEPGKPTCQAIEVWQATVTVRSR